MRLIDADEMKVVYIPSEIEGFEKMMVPVEVVLQNIDDMPTVDAVPVVTGTWKAVTDDGENYKRICTCCGKEAPFDELEGVYLIYPHCPWCGARMDGKGNGNETD